MCKCPVAVHSSEAGLLEEAIIVTPPPTISVGRLLSFVGHNLISIDRSFVPVKPDILILEELVLSDYGINDSIYATPAHTKGSVSVLLRSGEAFVGDLAANQFLTVFPTFAEDAREISRS
jgi:glyoxylase-like metal-dependent hydrolase (beta-lactamase superfamily II)